MAQLCQRQEDLDRRQVGVLIISFSAPTFAQAWLEETGAPFTLLVDPDRSTYRSYGLEVSFWRTWSPRTLWYYARNWGRRPDWQGTGEDLNQLGGNFVVDRASTLRFVHRSHEPVDRPAVDDLLTVFDRMDGPNS